ncbi:hypothetical protein F5B20DRAFT_78465 [Whalleya microplaca]|nr:hypothetical protein F5B20DRAFT_78465 [Whalleya microplaca]
MLSLYLQAESQRWAAAQQQHSYNYPASPSSTISDSDSIFSASRSRRSSVSSVASEDLQAPAQQFEQPRDVNGAPITVYASLAQAAQRSAQAVEAPRRLVTPGKLYENEEDDDEIVEYEPSSPSPFPAQQLTTTSNVVAVG